MVPFYAAALLLAFLAGALVFLWNTLPRSRRLALAGSTAALAAELWFYFDTTVAGRRVDTGYLVVHWAVLAPVLGLTLAFLRGGRWWYLVPGAGVLWLGLVTVFPAGWEPGVTGFLWYGMVYALAWTWAFQERPLGLLFALCLAADGFFPWFRWLRQSA